MVADCKASVQTFHRHFSPYCSSWTTHPMDTLVVCMYICMYMIFRCYYSNRRVVIDSEAPLHFCKATEPPAVKIREINLRSCRRELNPRRQRYERASNPFGHRGSSMVWTCGEEG